MARQVIIAGLPSPIFVNEVNDYEYILAGVYINATSSASISGEAAITEAGDTLASTGTLAIAGAAGITEADDTLAATGTLAIVGTASITEADDTLVATGILPASVGVAAITEDDDTLAATGEGDGVAIPSPPARGGGARRQGDRGSAKVRRREVDDMVEAAYQGILARRAEANAPLVAPSAKAVLAVVREAEPDVTLMQVRMAMRRLDDVLAMILAEIANDDEEAAIMLLAA